MNTWITRHRSVARTPLNPITDRLAQPLAVIEALDIHDNGLAGYGLILKLSMSYRH
jgi:hypothetical protein